MAEHEPRGPSASDVERLLKVVRELALELRPRRGDAGVGLDSDLDRDLGFDSLSRVELVLRLERELRVQLPEALVSAAETPRDLLHAVKSTSGAPRDVAPAPAEAVTLVEADAVPARAATLPEVLAWHVEHQGARTHVQIYETEHGAPRAVSYAALQSGAEIVAAGLARRGVEPGQSVAIMLPTGLDYLESFFGALLAGAVPVPIYPPARPSQLEDHLRRHVSILASARVRLLISFPAAATVGRLLKDHVAGLHTVVTPEHLRESASGYRAVPIASDDLALLQYTSGSTGQPKGVMLSHADLLTNLRAMGEHVAAGPDDVFVSWLPLYHDMGLIGAWLGSLYYASLTVLMSPLAFLARPRRWLWAIHEHRGTLSAAPNFAYELCRQKLPDAELEGLDLGSWRLAFNGAEPVSAATVRGFGERFARYGFDATAMTPVYGLAEVGVGIAFPPLGRGPLIDRVRRSALERDGQAVAPARDEPSLELVACGQPLRGYQIRVVDASGREQPERREGRLQFRGPSATRGYIDNPEATAALFDGDWLDSGDLAYIAGGDVHLTGRVKDVIIRAGRNLYPYELEAAVGDLPDVRKGCVAVFGSQGGAAGERLVVVAETRVHEPDRLAKLRSEIETLAGDLLNAAPDDVVLAPPHTVLKTSSGKIRRAACRDLYEAGRLTRGARSAHWQFVRIWLAALGPRTRRARGALADAVYAGWTYLLFAVVTPAALAGLAVLPSLRARWKMLHGSARWLLRLARIPVVVQGLERLPPEGGAVLVANHASYLDGLVLSATLPRPVSFAAKAELRRNPLARWFLERIDAQFVERFDAQQGTADAQRLEERARHGRALAIFPEGTFDRAPGLLPFRMGAFVTAAAGGVPVVPVTLRGTRSVLRSESWFPRRGTVAVVVAPPVSPSGSDWQAALALRDEARRTILAHLGEPDLGG